MQAIMKTVDWSDKVAIDFRSRVIADPDNPILAFKANRDRYTRGIRPSYAGLSYQGIYVFDYLVFNLEVPERLWHIDK